MRQTTAWTRAKGVALSDPQSAGRRQKAAQAARARAEAPFPARDDLCRPRGSLDALAASAAMWVEARQAGRLNPADAPFGLRLAPQGLIRPPVHAEGLA